MALKVRLPALVLKMPQSYWTRVSALWQVSSRFLLPATQEPGLINQDSLLGFTPSAKEPAVLTSAARAWAAREHFRRAAGGQGIWGQPAPAKAAIFPHGEGKPPVAQGKAKDTQL